MGPATHQVSWTPLQTNAQLGKRHARKKYISQASLHVMCFCVCPGRVGSRTAPALKYHGSGSDCRVGQAPPSH